MRYSIITMRGALQAINLVRCLAPGVTDTFFAWDDKPGQVNAGLPDKFPWGRPRSHGYGVVKLQNGASSDGRPTAMDKLNDLLEYCWLVYSKTLDSTGTILIGRQGDLWVPEQLARVGIHDTRVDTLWSRGTAGNIQVMDKWAPAVNDCWVLGGVHRRAEFELVSPRHHINLWNFRFHVVTAREIFGLLHFGYTLKTEPKREVLVCTDPAKAENATIEEYDELMMVKAEEREKSIRSLLSKEALGKEEINKQILGFDRSRLQPVVPPRR